MSTRSRKNKIHSSENFEYLRLNNGLSPLTNFEHFNIEVKDRVIELSDQKPSLYDRIGNAFFAFFLWVFEKRYARHIENELNHLQIKNDRHD